VGAGAKQKIVWSSGLVHFELTEIPFLVLKWRKMWYKLPVIKCEIINWVQTFAGLW